MARNRKPEYLKKLVNIQTANGYKVDIANYLCNPSLDNEYPGLRKVLEEDDEHITVSQVFYFKYYNGTGDYIVKTWTAPKDGSTWQIVNVTEKKTVKSSNRFSLNELIKIAEAI